MRFAIAVLAIISSLSSNAHARQAHWENLANALFPNAYPARGAAKALLVEAAFQRAGLTYLWSLPAMKLSPCEKGGSAPSAAPPTFSPPTGTSTR